jgi:signal peptidase I
MYPTLRAGDVVTVQPGAYDAAPPATGDVIVFRATRTERSLCDDPPQLVDLVKRVIGTPGQTIWSAGNEIYVDGHALDQSWRHLNPLGEPITRQTIPYDDYFVMGDNRPESCDSRIWGDVARASIIGRATTWSSTTASGSL